MTMPHLMNCDHSGSGWCLACVKQLHDELEAERGIVLGLESALLSVLEIAEPWVERPLQFFGVIRSCDADALKKVHLTGHGVGVRLEAMMKLHSARQLLSPR